MSGNGHDLPKRSAGVVGVQRHLIFLKLCRFSIKTVMLEIRAANAHSSQRNIGAWKDQKFGGSNLPGPANLLG